MKHGFALAIISFLAVIMILPVHSSALGIASLSLTQGPTSGGNSLTISGSGFIMDEDDSVDQIVGGAYHALALTKLGKLYSWGLNSNGELGIGSYADSDIPQSITGQFNSEKIIKVYAHGRFSMAITESNRVYAWGINAYGQLGLGTTVANYNTPQEITNKFNGETVDSITLGSYHSFAVTKSGKIFAWGMNDYGQLATGNNTSYNTPQDITAQFGSEEVKQFQAWSFHSVMLTKSGKVLTWGRNELGQLGDGGISTADKNTPQDITTQFGGETIVQLEVGAHFALALSASGRVFAWGQGTDGQLGVGDDSNYNTPQDITSQFGSETVSELINNTSAYSSFAITSSGKIFAWGQNVRGQLGTGDSIKRSVPTDVTANFPSVGLIDQLVFSAGYHGFVTTNTNEIYAWGRNDYGQLATGDTVNRNVPENITSNFNLETYAITQVSSIYFGSVKVQAFHIIDANTISLVVPPHSVGFVDIVINDVSGGITTLSNGYEYIMIGVPNTGEAL